MSKLAQEFQWSLNIVSINSSLNFYLIDEVKYLSTCLAKYFANIIKGGVKNAI